MELFSYLQNFQELLNVSLAALWGLIKVWWWLLLAPLLYFFTKTYYLWWVHWDLWYKEDNPWTIVEIVPPSEVKKPFRAMEDVYTALFWPLYDAPNWREVWCEGELENGPFWMSFEIVSFEGEIHFYARLPAGQLKLFESIMHAHYPDLEIIHDIEDYTKRVPKDVPNKEYRVYGEDYHLFKKDAYPITTYRFFEIKPEEVEEEKRLDPLSSLLESMAKLQKGEQLWIQIVINSVIDSDVPWQTEGRKEAEKLAKRPAPPEQKSITGEAFRLLAFNKMPFAEAPKEEALFPPEMRLTPGEREVLQAVEEKIAKHGFRTYIRSFYIAEQDAYFSPHGKILRSYFSHFTSQSLNTIRFFSRTRTKIHYFFRKRRLYTRQRRMFKRYLYRFPPLFPNRQGGTMILSAEELATLFHLPSKAAFLPPGVPRVAAKKGVPPSGIPLAEE